MVVRDIVNISMVLSACSKPVLQCHSCGTSSSAGEKKCVYIKEVVDMSAKT